MEKIYKNKKRHPKIKQTKTTNQQNNKTTNQQKEIIQKQQNPQ